MTMAGPLMRGRHTMAILEDDGGHRHHRRDASTIMSSIAARLGRDLPWRTELKQQISENKHRVYRDSDAIAALEDFLCRVARGEAAPGAAESTARLAASSRARPRPSPNRTGRAGSAAASAALIGGGPQAARRSQPLSPRGPSP